MPQRCNYLAPFFILIILLNTLAKFVPLVGASYHSTDVNILVPVCMVNDFHYWGLARSEDLPSATPAKIREVADEKGDWAMSLVPLDSEKTRKGARHSPGDPLDAETHGDDLPTDITIQPHLLPEKEVDAQFLLCQELRKWFVCPEAHKDTFSCSPNSEERVKGSWRCSLVGERTRAGWKPRPELQSSPP